MPDIAFINGRFLPWEEATVSIDDRGFQFGDAVYEVIRTYRGTPFEFAAHLARLNRSVGELSLCQPYTKAQWTRWIQQGLSLAGYQDAKIYIQVTRGVAPREHSFPADTLPTVVMTIREFHPLAPLAREEAKKAGVFETILVRDGFVMEGALSNVMAIQDGVVMTAPEGPRILSGVTRTVVLELAKKDDIVIEERFIPLDVLYHADEVFLTGTTLEVLGVVQIDGRTIGSGQPGPITKTLAARWALLTG
ncbi:MAG: aminotransferase class IV [Nitrospirae bacterium]|nr:aminotransferase class IV [Nitrospirota bacterium]